MIKLFIPALVLFAVIASPANAQPLTAAEVAQIDEAVARQLAATGVPSASISVVRGGRLVLARGYGKASETMPARGDVPYQVASISKQFTAMGLLLLEDEGKLDLDDSVAKWVPGITGGDRITIRQLLSHTAGLQDYWPQDYSFAAMEKPATPQRIADEWAKKPLDYAPGTRWQYSNTGYVVAGMILEKAAGEPLMAFLKRRVLDPVGMRTLNQDDTHSSAYPTGYRRNALGPVRAVTAPGRGWMFATGMLSLSAEDLAKWNIARLNRTVFPVEDWVEQETPVVRFDGTTNGYGLGVYNRLQRERRTISHSGGAVGFFTLNTVYPDSRAAITVLTNADFSGTSGALTEKIEKIVLGGSTATASGEGDRVDDARALYAGLVNGTLDRSRLTANADYYFDATTLADYRSSLKPLGLPTAIEPNGPPRLRGGFVQRSYTLRYAGGRSLSLGTFAEPGANGRWEQFIITPE